MTPLRRLATVLGRRARDRFVFAVRQARTLAELPLEEQVRVIRRLLSREAQPKDRYERLRSDDDAV